MSFTQLKFLSVFLPLAFMVAFFTRGKKWERAVHIALGFLFLLLSLWQSALFFLAFVLVNFLLSHLANRPRKILGIIFNLAIILLVKLLPVFSFQDSFINLILPLGLSYAALQALAFHLDQPEANLQDFLFYQFFFPKLPMGPLAEYDSLTSQTPSRDKRLDDTYHGFYRIIKGLAVKLLMADRLSLIVQTGLNASPMDRGWGLMLLTALVFPLQLYLDFSAYSHIALGLARVFGYSLPENFAQPFRAKSLRAFWRGWHISLTSWIGRYVYLPLGGSRVGSIHSAFNSLIVFALIALWHGLGWGFLLWGVFNALFISLERFRLIKPDAWSMPLRRAYVYLVSAVGFTFFVWNGALGKALSSFARLGNSALLALQCSPLNLLAIALGIALICLEGRGLSLKFPANLRHLLLLFLLVLSLLASAAGTHQPFIYAAF